MGRPGPKPVLRAVVERAATTLPRIPAGEACPRCCQQLDRPKPGVSERYCPSCNAYVAQDGDTYQSDTPTTWLPQP